MTKYLKRRSSNSKVENAQTASCSAPGTASECPKKPCTVRSVIARGKSCVQAFKNCERSDVEASASSSRKLATHSRPTGGNTSNTFSDGIVDLIISVLRHFQTTESVKCIQEAELKHFIETILQRSHLGSNGLLHALVYLKRASCYREEGTFQISSAGDQKLTFSQTTASKENAQCCVRPDCRNVLLTPAASETDILDHAEESHSVPSISAQSTSGPISPPLSNTSSPLSTMNDEQLEITPRQSSSGYRPLDLRCLFLTSVIVAHKYLFDKAYRIEAWLKIAAVATKQEKSCPIELKTILELERRFLRAFEYQCAVSLKELLQIGGVMKAVLGCIAACSPSSTITTQLQSKLDESSFNQMSTKAYQLSQGLVLAWLQSQKLICSGSCPFDASAESTDSCLSNQAADNTDESGRFVSDHILKENASSSLSCKPSNEDDYTDAERLTTRGSLWNLASAGLNSSTSSFLGLTRLDGKSKAEQNTSNSIASRAAFEGNSSIRQESAFSSPSAIMARDRARREALEAAMKAEGCGCD